MVSLDMTQMDPILLRYVAYLARIIQPEWIYFMHAIELDPHQHAMQNVLPDQEEPLEQMLQTEMEQRVADHFGTVPGVGSSIHILPGDATHQILEWANSQQVDMVVLGKKTRFRGSGIYSGKIVRLSQAQVLFVPESAPRNIQRILVPLDFSSYSTMALRYALQLSERMGARVLVHHVYRLPVHYFPVIEDQKDLKHKVKRQSRQELERFLQRLEIPANQVEASFGVDDGQGIAHQIYTEAIYRDVDLIVVGSKGRSDAAALLLGSVAESIIQEEQQIPTLVIKNKERVKGLIDVLTDWRKRTRKAGQSKGTRAT